MVILGTLTGCYSVMLARNYPTPSPMDCQAVGVDVAWEDTPTGVVIGEVKTDFGLAQKRCGKDTIGCTRHLFGNKYEITHEGDGWVIVHELCHALYEETKHTYNYRSARGML